MVMAVRVGTTLGSAVGVAIAMGVAVAGSAGTVGTGVAIPMADETQLVSKKATRLKEAAILAEVRCIGANS
jgi:hypothetical protein